MLAYSEFWEVSYSKYALLILENLLHNWRPRSITLHQETVQLFHYRNWIDDTVKKGG